MQQKTKICTYLKQKLGFFSSDVKDLVVKRYIRELVSGERVTDKGLPSVLCVVRNGMDYVDSFLSHHREIGINHFVFLVNNSNDGTAEYLADQKGVTVLQTEADYAKFENNFKRYLVNRYCRDRWCLVLDIDEYFLYPGYPSVDSLRNLILYCDNHNYDAVVTQMLDMFSIKKPNGFEVAQQAYYDLADIDSYPYTQVINLRNEYPVEFTDGSINFNRKGIRWKMFGTDNGLTKVSLLKYRDRMRIFVNWHHCENAQLANVSCALRHHPFSKSFTLKVTDAVRTGRYGKFTSNEYVQYKKAIDDDGEISFDCLNPHLLKKVSQLYDTDFLYLPKNMEV